MIFRTLIHQFSRYFDVICFVLAMVIADVAAFSFGNNWGLIAVAITVAAIGWLSEIISGNKGGD